MYYLLGVLGISVFAGVLFPKINDKDSKERTGYCIIIFFLLFAFSGLRGSSVGIDTANRAATYYSALGMDYEHFSSYFSTETGYEVVYYLFNSLFDQPYAMEMCFSAFIIGTHIWFFKKYASELPLTVALFIIFNFSSTMNTTRQYLAISICLIAFHFIIQRKFVQSVITILIASLFHTSALICLLFCLLAFKKVTINKKMFLLMIPTAVLFVFLYSPITSLMMQLFPHYARYLKNSYFMSSSKISIPWILIYIAVCVLTVIKYSNEEKGRTLNEDDNGNRPFAVMSVVYLAYVASDVSAFFIKILYRIMRYFYVGFTFVLPECVTSLISKDKKSRTLFYAIFTLIAVVVGYIEFSANKYKIFPYVFFWD